MAEHDISGISVDDFLSIFAEATGKSLPRNLLEERSEFDSTIELASNLRNSIMQNRDNIQQSRIDIQQTRIESQQTRLDLTNFKDECSSLFNSFEERINNLIELSDQKSKLLINDIQVICEEQIEQKVGWNKKRKLSSTEEELLSLTDPHYVPTADDIFGSHENSEQEESEQEEEEEENKETTEQESKQADDDEVQDTGEQIATDLGSTVQEPTHKVDLKKLPLYKMIRGTDSIRLIWDEYTKGINGGPAVRDLEAKYQGKWKDDTERKYFSYRKKLYRIIENIMRVDDKTEDEAIEYAEKVFAEQRGSKRSMTWLYDNISERYH